MRHALRLALLFATLLPAAACSDDDTAPDSEGTPTDTGDDTAGDDSETPAPVVCTVDEDLGDLGAIQGGTALLAPQNADDPESLLFVRLEVEFGTGPQTDLLTMDLYDGAGVFEGGIAPGTYSLIGDERDIALCGACLYIASDIDREADSFGQLFHASNGTLTIDAVETAAGGALRGSLSDVTLREVELSLAGQTDVTDGCSTSIGALEFDAMVQQAE